MADHGHKRLREGFLSYFEKKNHTRVNSSSLIPKGDRTLLFTNAGMNQFKDFFLDAKPSPYNKAVSCQKCLRAGGKHNDLDNVGYTSRHHTFFEMLGNFSFGDYFKEGAIEYAWDFIVNTLKIPCEKLYASVYNDDEEAYKIWNKNMGLSENKIFRFGDKENFWSMGDTGPCGPCSEIFFDLGEEYGSPVKDNDERFVEIWNLVFMQYDRNREGRLTPLRNKNIDTGMGLERTLAVLENAGSNFDTSLFMPIMKKIEEIFDKKYLSDKSLECVAFRVIADHCRSIAFLIADGQVPTNFSRGYVLRRIIRRAYRYGMVLGRTKPFLCSIIDALISEMSGIYPELIEKHKHISEIVQREEENFQLTLSKGIDRIYDIINDLKSRNISVLKGREAFRLYDTYGIPLDIINDIAKDSNITVDERDFIESMEEQKQRARMSSQFRTDSGDFSFLDEKNIVSSFIGQNDNLSHIAEIKAIMSGNKILGSISKGEAFIVTEETPFYAEKGGQVGDKGIIINLRDNSENHVLDTVYLTDACIGHRVEIKNPLNSGDRIILEVDEENRRSIERNHTATHILHYALREVLGEYVKQSGSLVDPERLRFDFTYHKQLNKEQINRIEYLAFDAILNCHDVIKEEMDYQTAVKNGAIALFTEKYEDIVRVVRIGDFSIELCGGTHIKNTGEIGMLKIVQESAIASGIRRIEAITGYNLFRKMQELAELEKNLKNRFIKGDGNIIDYVLQLNEKLKNREREFESVKLKLLNMEINDIIREAVKIEGINLIRYKTDEGNIRILKILMDNIKQKAEKSVIVIISSSQNPVVLCGITRDIQNRLDAKDLLNDLLSSVDGKGGGRSDLAQGGFKNLENINILYNSLEEKLKRIIG